MTLEKSFDETIKELEAKLSKSDIQKCRESARLFEFQEGTTYQGAYITAMLQKVELNTRGDYDRT